MAGSLLHKLSIGLSGVGNSPKDIMALAKRFEDAGFVNVGAGDSTFDSFTLCAGMAMVTERATIRTGVALWGRTPVQTAFAAATLDELSGGRFRLGLGPGPKARSEEWHNIPYDRVVARFKDYVLAIKTAYQGRPGAPVAYHGAFYQFTNFSLFRTPITPAIEIHLAANGPQMIRMAAEVADMILLNNLHGGRYLREVVVPAVRAAEAKAGRPAGSVKIGGGFLVSVAKSKEEAIHRARAALLYNFSYAYNRNLLDFYGMHEQRERLDHAYASGDQQQFLNAITDEIVDLFVVCGDGDYCRRVVDSYSDVMDEAGVNTPAWRGGRPGEGYDTLIEVFGR
ncbi:MAG: LLM class flavin-dependent oxidoreductase [Dehalococcoidia bacterium]|nr:LLM class flavin-dependent oxidoreductase [Dehalococcoidia bacterium]